MTQVHFNITLLNFVSHISTSANIRAKDRKVIKSAVLFPTSCGKLLSVISNFEGTFKLATGTYVVRRQSLLQIVAFYSPTARADVSFSIRCTIVSCMHGDNIKRKCRALSTSLHLLFSISTHILIYRL